MKTLLCTLCAAAMSLAALAPAAPAHAMPAPVLSNATPDMMQVRYDHGFPHGGYYRHGFYRGGYYGHDWHGGWWVPGAAFVTGAIIGNALAAPHAYAVPAGNAHVRWCYDHHPTYRAYDNSYRTYGGGRAQCLAPY